MKCCISFGKGIWKCQNKNRKKSWCLWPDLIGPWTRSDKGIHIHTRKAAPVWLASTATAEARRHSDYSRSIFGNWLKVGSPSTDSTSSPQAHSTCSPLAGSGQFRRLSSISSWPEALSHSTRLVTLSLSKGKKRATLHFNVPFSRRIGWPSQALL